VYSAVLPKLSIVSSEDQINPTYWSVIELYALVDQLYLPELMDSVMDEQQSLDIKYNTRPSLSTVRTAYQITPSGCTARKYLAYGCAFNITRGLEIHLIDNS
jgi:hypothetical protein